MNNEILLKMQQDMQIKKYSGETESYYTGRTIYSALCHWMRYAVLDETTQNYDRKSKKYLLSTISKLLDTMVEAFPVSRSWAFTSNNGQIECDDLVRGLWDKMIFAGELFEVDEAGNIGLPRFRKQTITREYERIYGLPNLPSKKYLHIGLTRVEHCQTNMDGKVVLDNINIESYLKWAFGTAKWNTCNNSDNYEYFNPYSKKPPYQSWSHVPPRETNKMLARISLFNGLNEYYLIKKKDDLTYNALLDTTLLEWKEERRIILGLRKKVGNQMQAVYQCKGENYILNLFCGLPLREKILIDTYCWPLKYMDDQYNFVIPCFLWEKVSMILQTSLGINIKEQS